MCWSKIYSCDGKFIRKGIYNGTEVPNINYKVTWKFAKQERPNSYSWKFWRKVLSSLTETANEIELKKQLGHWTNDHSYSGI